MRYIASAYGADERPEKPEVKKGEAEPKAPKGGWRSKSGNRKLGERAIIEADSFGDAVAKVGKLVGGMSDAAQKKVTRVLVALDAPAEPEKGKNPFEA